MQDGISAFRAFRIVLRSNTSPSCHFERGKNPYTVIPANPLQGIKAKIPSFHKRVEGN